MQKTRVVVADSSRARFFTIDTPKGPLQELGENLVHPESRSRPGELTTDRPHKTFDSHGPGRHALQPGESPQETEAREFARELAGYLDAARNRGEYERLILVAPPDFLGILRKTLGQQTARLVDHEFTKRLTTLKAEEIRSHLPEFLN